MYLYLLGAIPNRRPRRQTALVSWREVIKFDRYQEQFIYLMKNRIETMGQLSMQYDAIQAEIDALTGQRRELYPLRRAGTEGAEAEIDAINDRLRALRRELKLCARIENDAPTVRANVGADRSETHEKTDKSNRVIVRIINRNCIPCIFPGRLLQRAINTCQHAFRQRFFESSKSCLCCRKRLLQR